MTKDAKSQQRMDEILALAEALSNIADKDLLSHSHQKAVALKLEEIAGLLEESSDRKFKTPHSSNVKAKPIFDRHGRLLTIIFDPWPPKDTSPETICPDCGKKILNDL